MSFLIRQTLIYAVPLMVVALAGVFAERSGVINLALEGIMIFGAFIGVLFVRTAQQWGVFEAAKAAGSFWTLQGLMGLAMLIAAAMGALFSLLLAFAAINLRADQTIGGTALNLMAPALVLFFVRMIANQNTLQMATGDSAGWFMLKKSMLDIAGLQLTNLTAYNEYITDVIIAVIVYLAAFSLVIRMGLGKLFLKRRRASEAAQAVSKGEGDKQ